MVSSNGRFLLLTATIFVTLSLTACLLFSEKRWEYRIDTGLSNATNVRVAYDSPEVRKLLVDSPNDVLKMPGFTVPAKSYCSIIQRSTTNCEGRQAVYVLINVTSGPSRGKQGWTCGFYLQQLFP